MPAFGGSLRFASTWFKRRPMGGRKRKKYSVLGTYRVLPCIKCIAPVVRRSNYREIKYHVAS
jgi:hypothetical protein